MHFRLGALTLFLRNLLLWAQNVGFDVNLQRNVLCSAYQEGGVMMTAIKPATVLRNYSKELDELKDGDPVILTKNGVGKAVLVQIDEWQRLQAEIRLLTELNQAERNFGHGMTQDEFRQKHAR